MQPTSFVGRIGALATASGIVVASIFSSAAVQAQPSPTISGPDIELLLRTNLATAAGSGADSSLIRCPATRVYQDGDVARCTVPVGSGSIEILLVTLFYEGDRWRFAVDVQ